MASQTKTSASAFWPREHGAWGLLLQPFLAGAILAGHWTWLLIPALGLILLGFTLRTPLVILARQAFIWREANPQTTQAARWFVWQLAGLAVCVYWLSSGVHRWILLSLVAAGAFLTLGAVWMTIRNRQRSRLFQSASAVVLGLTAPFAVLVAAGEIPRWAWALWLLLALHGVTSIWVVHARLECRVASRNSLGSQQLRNHYTAQAIQLPIMALLAYSYPALVVPPLFSISAHLLELRRLNSAPGLREPLTRVGFRTLGIALIHLALSIASLWPVARGRL